MVDTYHTEYRPLISPVVCNAGEIFSFTQPSNYSQICYTKAVMQEQLDTKEEFSVIKRAKSFAHAGRGIWVFVKTTHNAWIHLVIFIIAVILGVYFRVTTTEWMMLILAGGFVLVSEAFNTAIEIDMNLTSPQYHPYAKDTKDVAAGAVLISAVIALIIGLLVFGQYLI